MIKSILTLVLLISSPSAKAAFGFNNPTGAALSVGTIDSEGSPAANGAVANSGVLILQSASATVPGLVNTTTQTFAGNKIFNGVIGSNGGFSSLPLNTATNTNNYSSNAFNLYGSYWTGSAAAQDDWVMQIVLGGGANPYSILNFAHTGTSGAVTTNFPAIDNTPIGPNTPSTAIFTTLSVDAGAFLVDANGNPKLHSTAPTPSSCGSGSIAAGSSNQSGSITGVSTATACTITFSSTLPKVPTCILIGSAAIVAPLISAASASAVTFGFTSYTGTLYYLCM